MGIGDNEVFVTIAGDAEKLANGMSEAEKTAKILDERLQQVKDTIVQIAEAYQVTNAEATKILSSPTMGGKAGLFDPTELKQALDQLGTGMQKAGADVDAVIAKYREDISKAITSIEELTNSEKGISVEEAKLVLGPLGTGEYTKGILNAAASAIQLRNEIADAGKIAQDSFGVTSTEAAAVFTASVQSAIVALKELQSQGMSLQQGKEALGPLGSGEYSAKVLQAAADTLKLSSDIEMTGKTAQESMGVTAGDAVIAYRERVAEATAAIQALITSERALNVEEAKAALGANGTGQFSAPVLNAAAKAYQEMNVAVFDTTKAIETFSMEERVGADAVAINNENVAQATILLQDMVAEIGQVSTAQAKLSLQGYGFSSAEIGQATQDFQALGGTFTDTGEKKDKFKINVGALGDMMRYVRLSAFLIFMTALNDIKQVFQDAVKDANDFSNAIFQLDVAVRAYQRDGFDVSLQQVHDKIAEIQTLYPYFNISDMDTAMAKLINSTKEFGVTSEQAFQLYGDAAKIATMTNVTMEEAVNKLMTAVTSGAHAQQALRTMGIAVNSDLELAYAKYNAIVDDTTNKLTLEEKAAAALGLIHEILSQTSDDVANKQDTLAGKTDTASTAWKNFLTSVGTLFSPFLKGFQDLITGLIYGYQDLIFYETFTALSIVSSFTVIGVALDQLVKKHSIDFGEMERIWKEGERAARENAKAMVFGNADVLPDTETGTPKTIPDTSNIDKAMADAKTKLEKIQEDLKNNLEKLWTDYYRDLDKITLDGERRRLDLILQYDQQMEKLSIQLRDNLAKEDRSYQENSLAEEVKFEQSVADAKEKYQEQVIADEKAYQEKIAQLRFDLENNLEDALATRDARQITRLIRAEQNAEESAKIAYENEKKARDEKFAEELVDLQRQEDERQKALEVAHENRMQEIYIQNKQEQDAALLDLQQKESALDTNIAQQRADRLTKFKQDKADLLIQTGKLAADLLTSLTDTYNLTADQLNQLYQLYDSYYGPNGSILSMLRNFYAYLAGIGSGGGNNNSTAGKGRAKGGIDLVNQPTNVTFGEAGPEAAIFIPLGGSLSNFGALNNTISGGGSGGKTVVEVWLSSDLQSRIVNQAQSGIVNVIMKELA